MITICYRARLQDLTQKKADTMDAATVKDVFAYIRRTYGKEACREAERMLVTVNGISICLGKNKKTPLGDGDTVTFFPICGGG